MSHIIANAWSDARLELRYPHLCDSHRRPESFGELAHFYAWWRRAVIYRRYLSRDGGAP